MSMKFRICILVLAVLAFAAHVSADTIFTTDGRKLEGKIVRQTDEFVEIEMSYGSVKVPLSKVEKIEKGKTSLEIFEEKYAQIDKKDVAALLELAKWCEENQHSRSHMAPSRVCFVISYSRV